METTEWIQVCPETCSNPIEKALIYNAQATDEKGLLSRNRVSFNDALLIYAEHSIHGQFKYGKESLLMGRFSRSEIENTIKAVESLLGASC